MNLRLAAEHPSGFTTLNHWYCGVRHAFRLAKRRTFTPGASGSPFLRFPYEWGQAAARTWVSHGLSASHRQNASFARHVTVSALRSEWAEAVAALELLMQEHDEDVELWYLLGLAHGLHGDRPTSSECMTHALQVSDIVHT